MVNFFSDPDAGFMGMQGSQAGQEARALAASSKESGHAKSTGVWRRGSLLAPGTCCSAPRLTLPGVFPPALHKDQNLKVHH